MDQLVADKEAVTAQLALVEAQLRGFEVKVQVQARKIEGLEAELAKALAEAAQAKAEAVKAKAEAEKTKTAVDKSISIYLREAANIQVELREASDRGRWTELKERETDARFLISSDDEDMVSGSGDEEREEDVPEGEENPEDRATEDVVSEDDAPGEEEGPLISETEKDNKRKRSLEDKDPQNKAGSAWRREEDVAADEGFIYIGRSVDINALGEDDYILKARTRGPLKTVEPARPKAPSL
ncbi:KNR4/SMI1 homolog [Nicotiana sylvestris]|uniref:KNR4/SMI1 homolog n=1 Tax=Nicotiana sylvestris TaxID=4096 RepID=UPI00388CA17C